MGLKHTANFHAPQHKLSLACMVFKCSHLNTLKLNFGDAIINEEGKDISEVWRQSKRSGTWSRQYSSKLKLSTVNVMSFHCRGVIRPPEVSRAKFLMDRLGKSATFLYLISNPHF